MGYIVDIKNSQNREFNRGVAYVGNKIIKFDGSDTDKANLLSVARAYSKTLLNRSVPISYERTKPKSESKNDREGDNSYTNGKSIVISAKILEESLDSTIGLVLHESSHIAITDFTTWHATKEKVKERGIDEKYTPYAFSLLNWIEDRRIDNWAYNRAPGFIKYYEALYWRYFLPAETDAVITEMKNREIKKIVNNYMFFIFNMMNDNVTLDELPALDEIAALIDLSNVERFQSTEECQVIALDVLQIILDNIDKQQQQECEAESKQKGKGKKGKGAGGVGDKLKRKLDADGNETDELDASELTDEELEELLESILDNHNNLANDELAEGEETLTIDDETAERIDKILSGMDIDIQEGIRENARKAQKAKSQKEKHKVTNSGTITSEVVHVTSGVNVNFIKQGKAEIYSSVPDGMAVSGFHSGRPKGKLLGKKLRLREEVREVKIIRQKKGRIDNRTIYTAGYTQNEMFYKSIISKYDNTNVHISVDASYSMSGKTWKATIELLTTLAYGFINIKNLRLQISFRYSGYNYNTGEGSNQVQVFYDSALDKIEKLECLPHVSPTGGTPEGICFKGMNKRVMVPLLNRNTLFINLSDGEPNGEFARIATKEAIAQYESLGMQVLAFFISDSAHRRGTLGGIPQYYGLEGNSSWQTFISMYGEKNSRMLGVENLSLIAKIINKKLFNFNK